MTQVTTWLRHGAPAEEADSGPGCAVPPALAGDLPALHGYRQARYAAEICAAGGHRLSPPGTPKLAVARYLHALLPQLGMQAAMEVTAIHSVGSR